VLVDMTTNVGCQDFGRFNVFRGEKKIPSTRSQVRGGPTMTSRRRRRRRPSQRRCLTSTST